MDVVPIFFCLSLTSCAHIFSLYFFHSDDESSPSEGSDEVKRLREELARKNAELEVAKKFGGGKATTVDKNDEALSEIEEVRRSSQAMIQSTLGGDEELMKEYQRMEESKERRRRQRESEANAGSKISAVFRGEYEYS